MYYNAEWFRLYSLAVIAFWVQSYPDDDSKTDGNMSVINDNDILYMWILGFYYTSLNIPVVRGYGKVKVKLSRYRPGVAQRVPGN
jgi:hypothetical protein